MIDAALAILSRRVREPEAVLRGPWLVREYLRLQLTGSERKRFGVLFLNAQHGVIAFEILFEGSLTQTSVYPREVVRRALQLNAASVILAHKHPSGCADPSSADVFLTASLQAALQCVDVRVLDHFIVGWPELVSLAERGLMHGRPESDSSNRTEAPPTVSVRRRKAAPARSAAAASA